MFLTEEQVVQLQELCEDVSSRRPRCGKVTVDIYNNMPRSFEVQVPVYDNDHVLVGYTTRIIRCRLPEGEIRKGRQRNRLPGKLEEKSEK